MRAEQRGTIPSLSLSLFLSLSLLPHSMQSRILLAFCLFIHQDP